VLIGCGWSLFFLALGLVVAERFWLDSGMVVVASLEPRQTPASFNPTKSSSNFCSRLTALKTVFSARFVFGGGLSKAIWLMSFPGILKAQHARAGKSLSHLQNVVTRSPPNQPVTWQPANTALVAVKRPVRPVM